MAIDSDLASRIQTAVCRCRITTQTSLRVQVLGIPGTNRTMFRTSLSCQTANIEALLRSTVTVTWMSYVHDAGDKAYDGR